MNIRSSSKREIGNDYLNYSWVAGAAGLESCLKFNGTPGKPAVARAEFKIDGLLKVDVKETGQGGLRVKAVTKQFVITVNSILDNGSDHIRQEIELTAKEAGMIYLDEIEYEIMLCPSEKNARVFIPTHWAYLGSARDMPELDTYYQHFTIFDGYKNQVRTPAVSAWGAGYGVTAAFPTPLAHLRVYRKINSEGTAVPCFAFTLEKPVYGPDHYSPNPYLEKNESLRYSLFLYPHRGGWQEGMKRWMDYFMQNFVKDDFDKVDWLSDLKAIWIKWHGVTRKEVDALADIGIKAIEVYPWTEPSKRMLDYIHSKGIKLLMEHYALSCYEIKPEEKSSAEIKGPEPERARKACKRTADRHPEWCLNLLPGDERLQDIYVHMDPHNKEFRKAKIREAVDLIKKGYDGIRYDNLLVLNGVSRKTPYNESYARATFQMLKEIKTAVRKINPEAVIIANNSGPDLFNIIDANMYEAGLSSESHMMEQAGRTDWEKSNYERAHLRMLTAQCIWGFAGKPYWIWDYPHGTAPRGREKLWMLRSVIFDILHDAIIGLAVPSPEFSVEENLRAYKMAAEISTLSQEPLGEISTVDNLAVRYFRPGIMLVMETRSREWRGGLKVPKKILRLLGGRFVNKCSYNLLSEERYGIDCARTHDGGLDGFNLEIDADGCAVIALTPADSLENAG